MFTESFLRSAFNCEDQTVGKSLFLCVTSIVVLFANRLRLVMFLYFIHKSSPTALLLSAAV